MLRTSVYDSGTHAPPFTITHFFAARSRPERRLALRP